MTSIKKKDSPFLEVDITVIYIFQISIIIIFEVEFLYLSHTQVDTIWRLFGEFNLPAFSKMSCILKNVAQQFYSFSLILLYSFSILQLPENWWTCSSSLANYVVARQFPVFSQLLWDIFAKVSIIFINLPVNWSWKLSHKCLTKVFKQFPCFGQYL